MGGGSTRTLPAAVASVSIEPASDSCCDAATACGSAEAAVLSPGEPPAGCVREGVEAAGAAPSGSKTMDPVRPEEPAVGQRGTAETLDIGVFKAEGRDCRGEKL